MNTWTRAERLTLLGILVAVAGILAALAIPELRGFLGFESTSEETPRQGPVPGQESPIQIVPQVGVQEVSESAVPEVAEDSSGTLGNEGNAGSPGALQSTNQLVSDIVDEPTDSLTGNSPAPSSEEVQKQEIQSTTKGIFSFDLLGCERISDLVRCSLIVKNLAEKRAKMNLCGASYIVDDMGRQPRTKVRFSGGNSCGALRLEPSIPRALEMSAEIPADSRTLSIVLADGNWFSFSGNVTFRDVPISQGGT